MIVRRASGPYCYTEVRQDFQKMYIFEDNPQRTADRNISYKLPKDSWYQIKYRCKGYLYRESERHGKTSCIRGLLNAYPLCTIGNMHGRFWVDTEFSQFSELLESDIYDILGAASRFTEVILPWQGIFKTEESGITEKRCPKIYWHLRERMDYLWWLLKMV